MPLFDVKQNYLKQKKSVVVALAADGVRFLESRTAARPLATLPYGSIASCSLTKAGRLTMALRGSPKPATIVSQQAAAILQLLDAALARRAPEPEPEPEHGAGATIVFSRRFRGDAAKA